MTTSQSAETIDRRWARRFFTIWTGQAFSLLGSSLVSFALIWYLTQKTGSATVLATASLVGLLPQIFLSPIAGAYVDRSNRRLVMIVADGLIALVTLGLAALFALGKAEIWQIYVLMFIRSSAGGFHWPAMQASTSLMVPKEHLARIQGFNQMLNGGMNIVSAPLGALLLAVLPMQGVLAIDVITALIAIVPLFFFTVPQPERITTVETGGAKTSIWQDFAAGLKYMWSWPGLLLIGVMATIINLVISPAFSLVPILVIKHFNGQAGHLAAMESAWGIGMIAGGLILGAWGGFKRRIYTTLMGLIGIGLGVIVLGLAPSSVFYLAVAAFLITGVANPICNGPLFAAVQAVVPSDMQGRVFTLIGSVASAMTPLGLIVAGPLADRFGVNTWFVFGGIVTILMGVGALFVPAIMHFEDGRNVPEQLAESPTSLEVSTAQGD